MVNQVASTNHVVTLLSLFRITCPDNVVWLDDMHSKSTGGGFSAPENRTGLILTGLVGIALSVVGVQAMQHADEEKLATREPVRYLKGEYGKPSQTWHAVKSLTDQQTRYLVEDSLSKVDSGHLDYEDRYRLLKHGRVDERGLRQLIAELHPELSVGASWCTSRYQTSYMDDRMKRKTVGSPYALRFKTSERKN